jgi:tetratricopeptide (TPR) repeat protein
VEEEGFWWIMSSKENEAADTVMCCASCGIAAVDNVKLKNCACGLVKYCSIACQKNHRLKHKKMCKKRLAELRDKDLFTQPDSSHWGECPICCLPLPIDPKKSTIMSCCSQSICLGCHYANRMREIEEGLQQRCAFCREPAPENDEEVDKRIMKRIKENNDPAAMCHMGKSHRDEGDYETSITYLTKAAELGHAEAHNLLSILYHYGEGVEKDMKQAVYHLEEGAIGGHPFARHNLGIHEAYNGNFERAKKHWIIAANLGYDGSLKKLMNFYAGGHASKEDYADALRAHQAAVDATKSVQRDVAEDAIKSGDW